MPTLVQITLKTTDAIPENFITNNFAVSGEVSAPGDATALMDVFKTFYDAIRTTVYPSTIAQSNHDFKLYIAGGSAPNYPFYENVWSMASSPSGTTLPSEVALCLSYEGLRIPGLAQARRRGRVYLGPCKDTMNVSGRPAASAITTILAAAQGLATGIQGVTSAEDWAVWSPSNGTAVDLFSAWMDNSWDTQRSRGLIRTLKTVVNL